MNSHDLGAKFSAQARLLHVYVAGPMTGIPDFNFQAFNAEAAKLREVGFQVENPAEHGIWEGAEWQDYLRYDLTRLALCDQIHLLPGWSKSKGARLELHIAKALGMLVSYADGAELVPTGEREAFEVFALPVRENGQRKTFYTEVLPFVPGPGVEVLGEPVRMVAAQSAPAGERMAFVDATSTIDPSEVRRLDGFREGWEAYASWQRTQAAGVANEKPLPDLMLSSYHEAIGWNACRQAMLAAVPAQPEKVSHSAQWPTTPGLSAAPARPAVRDQGEVLELLRDIGAGCQRRDMPSEQTIAEWAERIEAVLAASTGQEV